MNIIIRHTSILVAATVIVIAGTMFLLWQLSLGSGRRVSSSGNPGPWTVAQVRAFSGYTVLWLGEEYQGLPLTEVTRDVGDDNPNSLSPASKDAFVFTYGSCTIQPGNDACALPLTLIVEPRCYLPPELLSANQKTGPVRNVRGAAEQQDFMGGQVVWTGDVAVSILGSLDPSQVAQALRPVTETGNAISALAAPDKAQCSKIRGRNRSEVIRAMTPIATTPTATPTAPTATATATPTP